MPEPARRWLSIAHIKELFYGFRCDELANVYATRDRFAHAAALGSASGDTAPVAAFQALLRAGFGIAVANGLPTSLLVQSSFVWKGTSSVATPAPDDGRSTERPTSTTFESAVWPTASRSPRPPAAEGGPPSQTLTFDLIDYPASEFELVLLAALFIPPFGDRAQQHVKSCLESIEKLGPDFPAYSWARQTSSTRLLAEFRRLSGDGWPTRMASLEATHPSASRTRAFVVDYNAKAS